MQCRRQQGATLLELLVSVVIGTLLLGGLYGVTQLAANTQRHGQAVNELGYQGHFALSRMVDRARSLAPKVLSTPTAGTSGNWFAPAGCAGTACVMYCRNAASQLIQTVTTDTTCSGTAVLARQVTSFSATLPTSSGPLDRHVGVLTLVVGDGAGNTRTFNATIRFGGGLQ
ncbi:MAG: prepilin-type N-terminal cleavage/methylation domain-containing protein [Azonexus sp.]|nr:prepilin-type N-terminal cleavage/methylation domain-containing protein [Azonexus sp.]